MHLCAPPRGSPNEATRNGNNRRKRMDDGLKRELSSDNGLAINLKDIAKQYRVNMQVKAEDFIQTFIHVGYSTYKSKHYWFLMENLETKRRDLIVRLGWSSNIKKETLWVPICGGLYEGKLTEHSGKHIFRAHMLMPNILNKYEWKTKIDLPERRFKLEGGLNWFDPFIGINPDSINQCLFYESIKRYDLEKDPDERLNHCIEILTHNKEVPTITSRLFVVD